MFVFSLISVSCENDTIQVIPNTIIIDCHKQEILFKTDKTFSQICIWPHETDSSIESETVDENWLQTIWGEWYRIEGKLHSSHEIVLYIEENNDKTRRLKFSVNRGGCNDVVLVTQEGLASD